MVIGFSHGSSHCFTSIYSHIRKRLKMVVQTSCAHSSKQVNSRAVYNIYIYTSVLCVCARMEERDEFL